MARRGSAVLASTLVLTSGGFGCGGEAGRAAVGAALAVAETGVNRAITKDCWARCSPGYACNQESGLCEPGECVPSCPTGYACAMQAGGATCKPTTTVPTTHPVDPEAEVSYYQRERDGGPPHKPAAYSLTPARNESGQVQLRNDDRGTERRSLVPEHWSPPPETTSEVPSPSVGASSAPVSLPPNQEESSHLQELGAGISPRLESEVAQKWAALLKAASGSTAPEAKPLSKDLRKSAARYLNEIHQRVHPIFAEGWLPMLSTSKSPLALQDKNLSAKLSVALDRTGSVVSFHLQRTSGVALFDYGALEAFSLGAPFPPPPGELVSGDGLVHLRWGMNRDPASSCSTYFASLVNPRP